MKGHKLLISAYGCEPNKGSEQGVGWHWVLQLAKLAELVVITRSNNRDSIESALPDALKPRICFVYYDLPPSILRFKSKEKGLYPYYLLWQWGAYRRARKLVDEQSFDYSMHLTFGSLWMPTFMHRLPLPFIWGPVGGGEAVPWPLISSLPLRSRPIQYLRYGLMATFRFNPLLIGVTRRARIILVRTTDTARLIPTQHAFKVRVVLETAVDEQWLTMPPMVKHCNSNEDAVQVIYTGRLMAIKNVAVVIKAVAIALRNGFHLKLQIVGGGPMREALQELANVEGIADQVTFTGVVTQADVIDALRISDIYVMPSLKEGGVWSLMEAMSLGLPAVCINTSGMAVITDADSAVLVEPHSSNKIVEDFAHALQSLAKSPAKRQQIGNQARQRIQSHFRWQHKGDFMAALFDELGREGE